MEMKELFALLTQNTLETSTIYDLAIMPSKWSGWRL